MATSKLSAEARYDAMSDDELLSALGEVYCAVLGRISRHQFNGIDPDWRSDHPPNKEAQDAGLALIAKVEVMTDRFVSGLPENEECLFSWNYGLSDLKNDLRYE